MKYFLLKRIRLSTYLILLFIIFCLVLLFLPTYQFSASVLTLFSVNSFLYGFYLTPIQRNMRVRIVDFHKIIRVEASELYKISLIIKKLPTELSKNIQSMLDAYTKAKLSDGDGYISSKKEVSFGENEYRKFVKFCARYDGPQNEKVNAILDMLVSNEQNRNEFTMLITDRIYSNEWILMTILFAITFGFIMFMEAPSGFIFIIIKATLCAGLAMLPIHLIKLDTLTHKKFKEVWSPLKELVSTNFFQLD